MVIKYQNELDVAINGQIANLQTVLLKQEMLNKQSVLVKLL